MSNAIYLGDALALDETTGEVSQRRRLDVPRKLFGHMHLRGMTGAGKTSLGIIPLLAQFAAEYEEAGKPQQDSLFVIDFGGDQNAFWNAWRIAHAAGRVFRYLTLDQEQATHCFPPFQAAPTGRAEVIKAAQMLIRAFHMEHGLIYGGAYYSQQNLAALLQVAKKLSDVDRAATLEDVAEYLEDPQNRREFKDADQVRMTFSFLLEYPQLRRHVQPQKNILIDRALDAEAPPELVYFFCPTLEEPLTAPLVGGLALYTVLALSIRRKRKGLPTRKIRIFVDEFQEIVGRSVAALLAQSRKFGVSLFLANQSTSQLANREISLAEAVFEGTTVKQYYTCVGDQDSDVLRSLSKDQIRKLGGVSGAGMNATSNYREYVDRVLARDQILEQSAVFGRSFVILNDGQGHQEPLVVEQRHEFPDYSQKPMREFDRGDAVEDTPRRMQARGEREGWQGALLRLLAAKRAEEEWKMAACAEGDGGSESSP